MQTLFGLRVGVLAVFLAVACAVALGAVAVLALRNRIFFKLSVRNATRRRTRSALIVVGLMLGTGIVSSALNVGDTISHTMRSSVTKPPLQ